MGLRDNVFASRAERQNYYKLRRHWRRDYFIYPNLPFLAVFSPEPLINPRTLQVLTLTDLERARLKKTSVDYTLCGRDDRPLVCIDFDGLQEGVNVGLSYNPKRGNSEWRQEILSLKLKVAHGSLFPYFVVSSNEFEDIEQDIRLTIVDGIIGEVISSERASERIAAGFKPEFAGFTHEEFDALSRGNQLEIVQDWVWNIEIEEELEVNPVTRTAADMAMQLGGGKGWSFKPITYPELPPNASPTERMTLYRDVVLLSGVKLTLHTVDCGDIVTSMMLPNFQTPRFSGVSLVEEIAKIVAFRRYKRLRDQKQRQTRS